ncbi:hypothetical protein FZC84_11985 [Rossellomorea vietnamensis]|uniref:Uncharacterized protein n=1 Tax=Rossellomorea vietnamensis TaxID=218284 RepID=A0A5D4MAV6_9BACI|nr:hypothetical protein [Rossellomorea vietnamensis]TYR99089.1 hypothetical protein FZC84_11985 [Rossellomorea vietnamensis]
MRGICVDPEGTLVLDSKKVYYLFPNGDKAFYVSKFNSEKSHFGCFQAERFEVIEENITEVSLENSEEWPAEPEELEGIRLDPSKVYSARLVWRQLGYKSTELQMYYIRPKKTHADFYGKYEGGVLKDFGGCFPLHWFSEFAEHELLSTENVTETEEIVHETVKNEMFRQKSEQLSLF